MTPLVLILFVVGVGLFVYNIARTVFRAPKRSLTATAILAALAWLSLTVTAGLSIVAAKCSGSGLDAGPTAEAANGWSGAVHALGAFFLRFDTISTMHAHAHLGVVGFFTLLIVGVSYKLIPMFTLSEVRSARRAAASVVLLNLGLAGTFLAVLLRSSWKPVFAVVIILALGFYAVELIAILRARRRRALDWGIKTFLTAIWLAVPLSVIALILSWPGLPANQLTGRLENLYGFLGLVGMVSLAIIGMLYKIVPFLVWYGTYSRQAGLFKVPPLADLYSERLQKVGYGLYLVGLVLVSCGILASQGGWVRCGGALLTTAVLSLVLNVGVMLNHFFHPRLLPLTAANSSRL